MLDSDIYQQIWWYIVLVGLCCEIIIKNQTDHGLLNVTRNYLKHIYIYIYCKCVYRSRQCMELDLQLQPCRMADHHRWWMVGLLKSICHHLVMLTLASQHTNHYQSWTTQPALPSVKDMKELTGRSLVSSPVILN